MEPILPEFLKEQYIWLSNKVPVNLLNIDEDLEQLAELVRICGESTALAVEIFNRAEEGFKITKAVIAEKLRIALVNGKQPSESTIESKVPLDDQYTKSLEELQKARFDADLWEKLMRSVDSKQYNIRTATELISKGYITRDYIVTRRQRDIREVGKNS